MIRRDRELLVRLGRVNRHLGAVVVDLLHRQDGGELPPEGLRSLADHFGALSADLRARAAESDRHPAHTGGPALNTRQWAALENVLAEMCERTDGSLEDLHDRGRGVLETCRPIALPTAAPGDDTPTLAQHIHRVIGVLAHLAEAAPDDRRAARTAAFDVAHLARCLFARTRTPLN